MELSDLRIFRAVVDEGGITRAAEKLLRVQSSVTTRIKQLEQDLGTPLFLRQGKKLHLTPAGHTLVDYAQRLQALAEEARNAVQDPLIGLMRHNPVNVIAGQPDLVQRGVRSLGEFLDRVTEHLLALHSEETGALVGRHAAVDIQDVAVGAVA